MEHSTVSIIALGPIYRVHTVPLELSYIVLCRRFPCGVHTNIRAKVRDNKYIERGRLLDQTTGLPFLIWRECQPKYCRCPEEGKGQVFTLQKEGALFSHHREGALSPGPRTWAAVLNHCIENGRSLHTPHRGYSFQVLQREGVLILHTTQRRRGTAGGGGLSKYRREGARSPHTTKGAFFSIYCREGTLSSYTTQEVLSLHGVPHAAERGRSISTHQREGAPSS